MCACKQLKRYVCTIYNETYVKSDTAFKTKQDKDPQIILGFARCVEMSASSNKHQ